MDWGFHGVFPAFEKRNKLDRESTMRRIALMDHFIKKNLFKDQCRNTKLETSIL